MTKSLHLVVATGLTHYKEVFFTFQEKEEEEIFFDGRERFLRSLDSQSSGFVLFRVRAETWICREEEKIRRRRRRRRNIPLENLGELKEIVGGIHADLR